MAPIGVVLESFASENNDCYSNEAQRQFAQILESQRNYEYGPSESYLKSLLRLYVSRADASDNQIQDDLLLELILFFSTIKSPSIPDPLESSHVSFGIPSEQQSHLRLRVFPRHNDVALKLWEAGACLAEYLLENPHYVADKKCCELGAGVGLTGLVAACCCHPTSYHMTDYTEASLSNLEYNIQLNKGLLQKRTNGKSTFKGKDIITRVSQSSMLWVL